MSQFVTLIIVAIGIVVVLAAAYLLKDRWWPLLSHWKQEATLLLPQYQQPLRAIVGKLNAGYYPSMHDRISAIRNWVNTNSVHLIDDEHDSYAFHVPTAIKKLNEFNDGTGSRPHLSCGPRAYAMKEILDAMGIESRIIDLFVIRENGRPDSHTLIEVFNTETCKWELQDPDFNVAYTLVGKSGVACVAELLQKNDQASYLVDGYLIENIENLLGTIEKFFDIGVLYRHSYNGGRSCLMLKQSSANLNCFGSTRLLTNDFVRFVKARYFHPKISHIG